MEENKTYIERLTKEQILELESKVKATLHIPASIRGKIEKYNDHIKISYNQGSLYINFYEYLCFFNFLELRNKKDLGSAIYELYINFMKDNFEDYEIDLKANAYTF